MTNSSTSLFDEKQKNREHAQNQMKNSIDPRTGTVSYSGADFSAVVFLPMSTEQLTQKLKYLYNERKELDNQITNSTGVWNLYNDGILDELTDAEYALDRYYYYITQEDDEQSQFWFDEYIASKTREKELISKRNNAGGGASVTAILQLDLQALNEEILNLEKLRSQAEPFMKPVKLFDLQTITLSSHREKFPVRTLGRVHPKSYTRGPRTLAGSMIFTLFNKHALWELIQASSAFYSSGVGIHGNDSGYPELNAVLVDQLPPFDITLIASNELGDTSYAVLYGVEIINDGRTISIQDMITESVMQFVCRDFEDLRPLLSRRNSLANGMQGMQKTATDILGEKLTERDRRNIRLNPFI